MSNGSNILERIKECFIKLEGPDKIKELTMKALESGVEASQLITAIKEGLDEVGQKYENSEYFLSDLVMSGVMASEVTNLVKPRLQTADFESMGKVLLGTVKGDIHDIGKNLVNNMLTTQGFEVIDIGVDVSPEKFAENIKKHNPDILAMSCLLTAGMPEMSKTVQLSKKVNSEVKTMIGGRPITKEFADEIGADAYGRDAFEAIDLARKMVESTTIE
ncbi:cobalamin B12-binding domain-containing protein [[Eubacterium] cellulosolvens]